MSDTAIPTTDMEIVTVTNVAAPGGQDLTIGSVGLAAGSDPAFGFSTALVAGSTLAPGESADIEVTFSPVDGIPVAGSLEISSDDPNPLSTVTLTGRGVPFDEQAMALLDLLDTADVASTQGNRDQGLRNLLETAGDFIDRGQIVQACNKLADALTRVDGIGPPDDPPIPDFIEGPDLEVVASAIGELSDNLGCGVPNVPRRACGIGFELALILPALALPALALARRRRGTGSQR